MPSKSAKYDQAYTEKKDFVDRPNAFLADCLRRIAREDLTRVRAAGSGRQTVRRYALDIGLGQGRNAISLARAGYLTTGIDRSEVGVRSAQRAAAKKKVHLKAVLEDTVAHDYGRDRWDVIVLMYYPKPMILLDRVKAAVRPGGYIIVERFSRPEINRNPRDRAEARRPSPMIRRFLDWQVLQYENDNFPSDWHWNGESPSGPIVRLLARKPLGSVAARSRARA
jgi:2-polyprenyl-3-methyl-5-hydroxy-6-metoxy-1,4-benzoquinol methylase